MEAEVSGGIILISIIKFALEIWLVIAGKKIRPRMMLVY